jgi:hypothetical protein
MESIVAAIFVMIVVMLTFVSVFVMEMDIPQYEIIVAEDGNMWLHNVWEGWYYLIKVEG